MTGHDWNKMSREQRRAYSARTLWALALETAVLGSQYEWQMLPASLMAESLHVAGFDV